MNKGFNQQQKPGVQAGRDQPAAPLSPQRRRGGAKPSNDHWGFRQFIKLVHGPIEENGRWASGGKGVVATWLYETLTRLIESVHLWQVAHSKLVFEICCNAFVANMIVHIWPFNVWHFRGEWASQKKNPTWLWIPGCGWLLPRHDTQGHSLTAAPGGQSSGKKSKKLLDAQ